MQSAGLSPFVTTLTSDCCWCANTSSAGEARGAAAGGAAGTAVATGGAPGSVSARRRPPAAGGGVAPKRLIAALAPSSARSSSSGSGVGGSGSDAPKSALVVQLLVRLTPAPSAAPSGDGGVVRRRARRRRRAEHKLGGLVDQRGRLGRLGEGLDVRHGLGDREPEAAAFAAVARALVGRVVRDAAAARARARALGARRVGHRHREHVLRVPLLGAALELDHHLREHARLHLVDHALLAQDLRHLRERRRGGARASAPTPRPSAAPPLRGEAPSSCSVRRRRRRRPRRGRRPRRRPARASAASFAALADDAPAAAPVAPAALARVESGPAAPQQQHDARRRGLHERDEVLERRVLREVLVVHAEQLVADAHARGLGRADGGRADVGRAVGAARGARRRPAARARRWRPRASP